MKAQTENMPSSQRRGSIAAIAAADPPALRGPDPCRRGNSHASLATAGFSLLELMVVLAVLALVAAIIVPRVPFAVRALALKAEARIVRTAMEEAAAQAIAARRAQTVVLDMEARTLTSGARAGRPLDPEIAVTATFAQGARADPRVASFTFYPDGTATGGRITLTRGRKAIAVEANWLTGAVRSFDVAAN